MRKSEIIILGIISLSFIVGVYLYPQMPNEMASHWNIQGDVDDYLPKFWGLFLIPIALFGLWLMFILIPRIDPLKENIEKFRKYFDWFVMLITLFLFYIYLLTIFWNVGIKFKMTLLLTPALAALFFYIGILLDNAKRNWFIGIRTPWTLSSDNVWNKTHRFGGKLFKIVGIVAFFGVLFPVYAMLFVLISVILISLYLIVYSYFEYQKEIS